MLWRRWNLSGSCWRMWTLEIAVKRIATALWSAKFFLKQAMKQATCLHMFVNAYATGTVNGSVCKLVSCPVNDHVSSTWCIMNHEGSLKFESVVDAMIWLWHYDMFLLASNLKLLLREIWDFSPSVQLKDLFCAGMILLMASDFGLAQRRKRLFILGVHRETAAAVLTNSPSDVLTTALTVYLPTFKMESGPVEAFLNWNWNCLFGYAWSQSWNDRGGWDLWIGWYTALWQQCRIM